MEKTFKFADDNTNSEFTLDELEEEVGGLTDADIAALEALTEGVCHLECGIDVKVHTNE